MATSTIPNPVKRTVKALAGSASISLGTKSVKALCVVIGGTTTTRGTFIISGYGSSNTDVSTIGGDLSGMGITVSGQTVTVKNNTAYSVVVGIDVYSGSLTIS